jgi:hypothetical protein
MVIYIEYLQVYDKNLKSFNISCDKRNVYVYLSFIHLL